MRLTMNPNTYLHFNTKFFNSVSITLNLIQTNIASSDISIKLINLKNVLDLLSPEISDLPEAGAHYWVISTAFDLEHYNVPMQKSCCFILNIVCVSFIRSQSLVPVSVGVSLPYSNNFRSVTILWFIERIHYWLTWHDLDLKMRNICGFLFIYEIGVDSSPLLLRPCVGPLFQSWKLDGTYCEAIGGRSEWQGNLNTWRNFPGAVLSSKDIIWLGSCSGKPVTNSQSYGPTNLLLIVSTFSASSNLNMNACYPSRTRIMVCVLLIQNYIFIVIIIYIKTERSIRYYLLNCLQTFLVS
jgi:hypothetical protein